MTHLAKWKVTLILGVCFLGSLFAIPNLFDPSTVEAWPTWMPKTQVNLGLDLKGGSHLLLEVDTKSALKERLNALKDELRGILRKNQIGYTDLESTASGVTFTLREADKASAALKLIQQLDPQAETSENENKILVTFSEKALRDLKKSVVAQSIEIVRRRIDETGTKEPTIQPQGEDRIVVQLPGVSEPHRIKELIGKTSKLSFRMVDLSIPPKPTPGGYAPPGSEWVASEEHPGAGPLYYLVHKKVVVSGEMLVDAQAGFYENQPVVNFTLDSIGTKRFSETTRDNKGKIFAILLDNKIISAPSIKDQIPSGRGYISGSFTVQSANDLALLLRAGALPAPLKVLEERTVGPGLGGDSIAAGEKATVLAVVLVVLFMLVVYRFLGLIANIALLFNLVLLVGAISLMGATLTLPGIAGIALTLGMAVDANVLIYERIKEELSRGQKVMQAVDTGYKEAMRTIVDSNATTLIGALLLYQFGTGPVKGFAVTLGLGIIISMFTAISLTRVVMVGWLKWKRPKTLPFKVWKPKKEVNFIGLRKYSFFFSALIVILPLTMLALKGLNYGVDFKGGTSIEVRTAEVLDIQNLRSRLNSLQLGELSLQEFGSPRDLLIRLEQQEEGNEAQALAIVKVKQMLGDQVEFRRIETVGPTVGQELVKEGLYAILWSLGAMLIYIWFRFEWQFGVCAILALIHDSIAILGLYSVFQLEFNATAIVAILITLGYSINDTVVIYDRIRENLRRFKAMDLKQLFNLSINETLNRTILTSSSTLLALLALYFLGGEVISLYSLPIIVGVVVGTYSSIFIASPLLLFFNLKARSTKTEVDKYEGI